MQNFEVMFVKITEVVNERLNIHTNGQTERQKLYTPRHKYRGFNENNK